MKRILIFTILAWLLLVQVASADITTGLLYHWKCDEGSGTNVSNAVTPGTSDMTLSAGATFTTGHIGAYACLFDGTNDYGSAPTVNLTGTNIITLAFWAYIPTYSASKMLVELSADSSSNIATFHVIEYDTSPTMIFQVTGNTSPYYNYASFTPGAAAAWHHYVFIMDFGQATPTNEPFAAYLDSSSQTLTPTGTANNTGNFGNFTLYFASRGGTAIFASVYLDDIRLYNRGLAAGDITELYNFTGVTDNVARRRVQ